MESYTFAINTKQFAENCAIYLIIMSLHNRGGRTVSWWGFRNASRSDLPRHTWCTSPALDSSRCSRISATQIC